MTRNLKIAEFKSQLSRHLGAVRKGAQLVIFDRDHPIAKVIPFQKQPEVKLTVQPAKIPGGLKSLKLPERPPFDIDVVKLLREDRDRR